MTTAAPHGPRIVAFIVAGDGPHLVASTPVNAPSTPSEDERSESGTVPPSPAAATSDPA